MSTVSALMKNRFVTRTIQPPVCVDGKAKDLDLDLNLPLPPKRKVSHTADSTRLKLVVFDTFLGP